MLTHNDPAELARLCAWNAHTATSKEVARELWKMASEYRNKAAALDSGRLPDIGAAPAAITGEAQPLWHPIEAVRYQADAGTIGRYSLPPAAR